MKKFIHVEHPIPHNLHVEEMGGKRYYTTPSGLKVPSVTSVLGYRKSPGLMKWKKTIGEKESNRVLKKAGARGTRVHNLCEQYIKNEIIDIKSMMPDIKEMFNDLRSTLDRIDNIRLIEAPLYSEKLKLAGRTDIIGDFDSVPSIIDFKTSLREKPEDYVIDYFLQGTAYTLMYNKMFNEDIKQIVIIILCDDRHDPQVFIKDIEEYKDKLYLRIIDYWKHNEGYAYANENS